MEVLLSSSSHKECICWMPLNQMNLMKNVPDWKIYCNNVCLNFLLNTQKVHKRTKSLQYSTSISRYFIEGYTVVTHSTWLLWLCENGLESQFKIPWYFQVFQWPWEPWSFFLENVKLYSMTYHKACCTSMTMQSYCLNGVKAGLSVFNGFWGNKILTGRNF